MPTDWFRLLSDGFIQTEEIVQTEIFKIIVDFIIYL